MQNLTTRVDHFHIHCSEFKQTIDQLPNNQPIEQGLLEYIKSEMENLSATSRELHTKVDPRKSGALLDKFKQAEGIFNEIEKKISSIFRNTQPERAPSHVRSNLTNASPSIITTLKTQLSDLKELASTLTENDPELLEYIKEQASMLKTQVAPLNHA